VKTRVVFSRTAAESTDTIAKAVALLNKGECVALPTETVYGLAADALSADAVVRIFEVKHRPAFDPLIVHVPNRDWFERIGRIREEDRPLIEKLLGRFWPGPFTVVLPRRSIVPDIVTGGHETVAIRMSSHPMFSQIIAAFGLPLAAPSANRFGRISPTTAQHVIDELGSRIPLIVDAGPTALGLESTIVAIREAKIRILRRGPVTEEQLATYSEVEVDTSNKIATPGRLATHYAPKTPLRLIKRAQRFVPEKNQRVGLLAWNPVKKTDQYVAIRQLSKRRHLRDAAANLFRCLRELDDQRLDVIVAEQVPEHGLGAAIMDRLRRAAGDSQSTA
jgi:L-threonylcarbamoyladenylate synthase